PTRRCRSSSDGAAAEMGLRRQAEWLGRASPLVARPLEFAARTGRVLLSIPGFGRAWVTYRHLPKAEKLRLRDADPRLSDRLRASPFDSHYLHQAVWAAERI